MSYELLIKNAVLRGADNALTQVGIRGDKIVAVGAQLGGEAERVIDAEKALSRSKTSLFNNKMILLGLEPRT